MLTVLNWFLIGIFGLIFFYLALLSLLTLGIRRKKSYRSSPFRKFVFVVPAHNEERTITRTLESLCQIEYPTDLADVVVLADNCTDETAVIAAGKGAKIFERFDMKRLGKGYALEWVFERLLEPGLGYDAIVVIDADSVVSKNFLSVMNGYLGEGHCALQAVDVPEARPGVWSSEVVRVGMTLYNVTRPLGRRQLGFTAGLRGNGMCFSVELLRKIPWKAYSLTEDLEYALQLLMNGVATVFVPEAMVYAALPSRLSNTQRERWETGRFSVVKDHAPRLLREALRTRSLALFDALADLLIPPFVNAYAVAAFLACAVAISYGFGLIDAPALLWGWIIVLLLGGAHVLVGLLAARADKHLFHALAYVPRYAAWKFSVYAGLLLHGMKREWIRTARD